MSAEVAAMIAGAVVIAYSIGVGLASLRGGGGKDRAERVDRRPASQSALYPDL
jgi:hypothetical protein